MDLQSPPVYAVHLLLSGGKIEGEEGIAMKKLLSVLLAFVCMFTFAAPASAMDFDDFLGGLTSIFKAEEKTYGVGETVEVDDVSIELINVMESKGNSTYTPAQGNEYLLFEFEIENLSNEEVVISTILCFNAWCDDVSTSISLDALSLGALSGKYQLDRVVAPGEKATGIVGYEVSQDWKEMKIQFSKEFYFGETVTFAVER